MAASSPSRFKPRSIRPSSAFTRRLSWSVSVLSGVGVSTAWSGYQTGLYDGHQAHLYSASSLDHLEATQASTLSGQQRLYDALT